MQIDLLVCFSTELEGRLLRERLDDSAGISLLRTGIGPVNAAHAVTWSIAHAKPAAIINCGVGGAYPYSGLELLDVVSAETECYGDLGATSPGGFIDMQGLGLPVIDGPPAFYNVIPMDIFPSARRARFVTNTACTGVDDVAFMTEQRTGGAVESMEGAAVAHVAHLHGIPVGELRAISNIVGRRDRAVWRIPEAADAAQEALLAWIASR